MAIVVEPMGREHLPVCKQQIYMLDGSQFWPLEKSDSSSFCSQTRVCTSYSCICVFLWPSVTALILTHSSYSQETVFDWNFLCFRFAAHIYEKILFKKMTLFVSHK